MTKRRVANASPLIVLAKLGRLDLVEAPGIDVVIPEPVAREVLAGPISDPARQALEQGWGRREPVPAIPGEVLEWGLNPGESAVLALALAQPGSVALVDDSEARACAAALRVPVLGTLGLILRARRSGRLNSAADLLRSAKRAGLFLDERLVKEALREIVGEEWEES